jgi:adenylate cyclase
VRKLYDIGPLQLDPDARVLTHAGVSVALGARSVAVLSALVSRANEYVQKATIMDAAWPGLVVEEANLSVQISLIRRALARVPGGDGWIETLPRRGYRFVGPVAEIADRSLVGDVASAEPRPSIAVLPFRRYQTDSEDSYFADGIVDVIIHALAALKELFVIARGSTLGYGGATLDVRKIGHELGVRYLLYGSVSRSGGRIRISTELSDTETGNVVRADQYDGDFADLFGLQDRIAASVVNTIAPNVRERELARVLRKHPQNMTAYDFVLQAIDLLYRLDAVSFSRAGDLLQQAIAHDPGYAPAHSYAALWHLFRVGETRSTDPKADAAAAETRAAAAIEREGDDAQALAIYGHARSYLHRDYATALQFLDRAIAAGPSSAIAWSLSSATVGFMSNGAEAVRRAEQAVRLSPLDARTFLHEAFLARAHYVAGDHEQALVWSRRAVARNTAYASSSRTLIGTLVALGRLDEAAEAAHDFLQHHPSFRVGAYARRCPFQGPVLDQWIANLRRAGLPE